MNCELLRRRRVELGLTQAELAGKTGCDVRTIQRAETGKPVSLRTARDIAQAIGVDLPTLTSSGRRFEDRVMAAFQAADDAIQKALASEGAWGVKEATAVLSLLVTRYGTAIARESDSVEAGLMVVQVALDQAKAAMSGVVQSKESTGFYRSGPWENDRI